MSEGDSKQRRDREAFNKYRWTIENIQLVCAAFFYAAWDRDTTGQGFAEESRGVHRARNRSSKSVVGGRGVNVPRLLDEGYTGFRSASTAKQSGRADTRCGQRRLRSEWEWEVDFVWRAMMSRLSKLSASESDMFKPQVRCCGWWGSNAAVAVLFARASNTAGYDSTQSLALLVSPFIGFNPAVGSEGFCQQELRASDAGLKGALACLQSLPALCYCWTRSSRSLQFHQDADYLSG